MLIECRIQEPDRTLANGDALLIQQRHDASEDWGAGACPADAVGGRVPDRSDVQSDGCHIREAASLAGVVVNVGPVVGGVVSPKMAYGGSLVRRRGEVVRKPTAPCQELRRHAPRCRCRYR